MKRRKVLYVLAVLFALCLLCFAGCNEDKRPTELKSDLGITVSGDRFEPGVELVTTRLKLSDERVREALKKLPEEYFSSDDSEIAAIDIALVSGGFNRSMIWKCAFPRRSKGRKITSFIR